MRDILEHSATQSALAVVVVLVVASVGIYIAKSLRPATRIADTNVDDLAQNFAEMQREGDISDVELRRIKSVLGKTERSNTGD